MSTYPLLSLAIWLPIFTGLVVLATGADRNAPLARMLALFGAIASFLITIPLWTGFDIANGGMQFVELRTWIPRFNINYHLGVDGISMLFVVLNAFITIIVVAAGWEVIQQKVAQYNAAFLIMSGLMNGIFTSLDGMLFYVFFEASLIPLYLIIGVWGGRESRLCCVQVFSLHPLWLAAFLAGTDVFVCSVRWKFLHSRMAQTADFSWVTDLVVPRLPDCVRGQGSDVACAYMVA
jgi:NADH:ubiquinone oxidoreductase subunit 4 (subunit M)